MQVAIVEDDPVLIADLAGRFEKQGWTVIGTATSSEDGRKLLQEKRPDLVMLDVELEDGATGPSLSGPARERGTLVVFLTGRASLLSDEISQNYPVLSKPYREADIDAVMRRVEKMMSH